ncbi:MAG: GGDEF domain-containing protein [Caldimonas sp.]
MDLELTTLLVVCIAIGAAAAGVLTIFRAMQTTHRGFDWWVSAQWTIVAGLLGQAVFGSRPGATPFVAALLLQWPIVVLAGLRRLDLRKRSSVAHAIDAGVFVIGWGLVIAAWHADVGAAQAVGAFSLAAFGILLYAAVMVTRLNGFERSFALKALAAIEAMTAALEAVCSAFVSVDVIGAQNMPAAQLASQIALVVAALGLVPIAIALTYERTVAKMQALHKKLRHLADVDVLTRLPNRRHFHELATRCLAGTDPAKAVVMLFDVEGLKRINDLLGQQTGDEALRQVGLALRETLRTRDVVGRLDGDEFAALLPETNVGDAVRVAERVNEHLENRQVAPNTVRLVLNAGAVQMRPGEAITEGLRRAESALDDDRNHRHDRPVSQRGSEVSTRSGGSGWTHNAA